MMSSRLPLDRARSWSGSRYSVVNSSSSTASTSRSSSVRFPSTASTTGTSIAIVGVSAQVIELGQRKDLCRLDGNAFSVHVDVVILRVDLDLRKSIVQHHVSLRYRPRSLNVQQRLGLDLVDHAFIARA